MLAVLLLPSSAFASQESDLEKLRQRLAAIQRDFEQASESRSEVADALRDSERAISDSNRNLSQLTRQRHQADRDLDRLQQRSAELSANYSKQQSLLGRLLYRQYIGGVDQDYLKLLLNSQEPSQLARELRYYDYIARERADTLQKLRSGLAELQTASRDTQAKQQEIAALQASEKKELNQLQREQDKRRSTLRKIALQLKKQQHEIDRLKRNEARLTKLVGELGQLSSDGDGTAFKALKGKLALPVSGEVSNRYGERRAESNLPWTGWFVRAAARQPVLAVAAGRVVYADWLRGFGNLLIVDHGQGFMSLYGNNETLYKQVGDNIQTGDIVASVGNSGGNVDSGLYFELRYKGSPFNPDKWIKLPRGKTR
ncbi:MAG: peptidoglycan DD-metalloendopeptidase family protein [Sideroxydans sp.]|nr:peptidoglycan DD-metalloendopeptidase family protein [Sideroxydans sp.]